MNVLRFACLCRDACRQKLGPNTLRFVHAGVEAYVVPTRLNVRDPIGAAENHRAGWILVIPGSNEDADWIRDFMAFPRLGIGDSWRMWHGGFLDASRLVYGWLLGHGKLPVMITGHSMGSAIAQIVGASLGVPTVTFAAPRPLWIGPDMPNARARVHNIALRGDPVAYAGRLLGFRHVGRTTWLDGVGHSIDRYIHVLSTGRRTPT